MQIRKVKELALYNQIFFSLCKKKFAANYTVEAAYIMAITLLALSVLIQSAYSQYEERTSVMRLHHVVEQLRGQEQEENRSFLLGKRRLEAGRYQKKAGGSLEGEGRSKEIIMEVHEPENMMRMMTIFQPKDE